MSNNSSILLVCAFPVILLEVNSFNNNCESELISAIITLIAPKLVLTIGSGKSIRQIVLLGNL